MQQSNISNGITGVTSAAARRTPGPCGCETQHGTFISQEATNHNLKLEQQFIIP